MAETFSPRHALLVRVTHWLTVLSFFALLVTGVEIIISHPRFYWGETGNVNIRPLFTIPIPSSRSSVPTGYGYVLPDQNGWSRYLHFQSAWILLGTGLLYAAFGFFAGHFRRNLLPARADLSPKRFGISILQHLRFERPSAQEAWSYNVLQRLAYLVVIFLCFPLLIWTGLAMSPAFESLVPSSSLLGGHQSARTIHFFVTGFLVAFLLIHLLMIVLAGFRNRMRAMISGRVTQPQERV